MVVNILDTCRGDEKGTKVMTDKEYTKNVKHHQLGSERLLLIERLM